MTPERWQQIKSLIELALEQPAETRMEFLSKKCGGDKGLYDEVIPLILAESEMESFLEIPATPLSTGNSYANTLKYTNEDLLQRGFATGEKFLDKYEIVGLVGKGGMGLVYQAKHIELDKFVAIKILNTRLVQDEDAIERFKREARTLARLEHPNIVKVFDYGVKGTLCYLIMEYLQGESLRTRLKNDKQASLKDVKDFVKQVCAALEFVHKENVIHRDLKPDNIFFHQEAGKEIIKLLDFGIAKLSLVSSAGESLTVTGSVFGTPQYMSPEQCEAKVLDARSDIYSLGLILYEMISGSRPYEGDSPLSFMYAHVHTNPRDLAEVMPNIPQQISKAVMYSLVKDRENRCQDAKEFLQVFSGQFTPAYFNDISQISNISNKESSTDSTKAKKKAISRGTLTIILLLSLISSLWITKSFWEQTKQPSNVLMPSPSPKIEEAQETPTLPLSLKDKFVFIKGDTVTIGTSKIPCPGITDCETSIDETPAHKVTLGDYFLSKYEITNQEYYEFIKAKNYLAPKHWEKGIYLKGTENFPIVNVSWEDAVKYCAWSSEKDGVNYRLPTEEEWENAARGKESNFYPWGNAMDKKVSYAYVSELNAQTPSSINNAPNNTTDVSSYGVFAMLGNVREWTSSDIKAYPKSEYQVGEKEKGCKIIRGASFYNSYKVARNTVRSWEKPTTQKVDVGFRLAISVGN